MSYFFGGASAFRFASEFEGLECWQGIDHFSKGIKQAVFGSTAGENRLGVSNGKPDVVSGKDVVCQMFEYLGDRSKLAAIQRNLV